MRIFVEGADGSGKSTLVNQLNKEYTSIRTPRGGYDMYDAVKCNADVVYDRSPLTELVYRVAELDYDVSYTLEQIDEIFNSKSVLIYCKTDTQFEDSLSRGEDNIVDKDKAKRISQLYDDFVTLLDLFTEVTVIRYNWKKSNVEYVKSALNKIKQNYNI